MLVSIDKWGRIARGGPASLVICGGKNQTQSPTRMLTSASHGPAKCLVDGFSQANSLCNEIILILLCIEYDETSWPCPAARSLGGHGPPPARWAIHDDIKHHLIFRSISHDQIGLIVNVLDLTGSKAAVSLLLSRP